MRRLVIAGMLSACVVTAGSTRTLKAFVSNGHTWATSVVPFYVNPSSLYLSPNEAITALQLAAANWSSQSNASVALAYAGTTSGSSATLNRKNEIFFRNESNGYLGALTYWWYDGTGHLVDADIVFYEASYVFFTGSSGCQGNGEYVEDLGTHEFGHVLGLGHSADGSATMYATNTYCDENWRTLASDDVSGIEALYPPGATIPQPPSAPTQLAVTANASNPSSSLNLTWIDTSNESGYRVDQSNNGSTFTQIAQLGAGATSYTATGLAGATQYWYRVSAYNSAGASAYSNIASGSTQTATVVTPSPTPLPTPSPTLTAPSAPASPVPANGATGLNITTNLGWGAASQAQRYDVYFGTATSPALYAGDLTSPSLALPNLAQGTTYYWYVVAKNSVGNTSGPTWKFTTKSKGK